MFTLATLDYDITQHDAMLKEALHDPDMYDNKKVKGAAKMILALAAGVERVINPTIFQHKFAEPDHGEFRNYEIHWHNIRYYQLAQGMRSILSDYELGFQSVENPFIPREPKGHDHHSWINSALFSDGKVISFIKDVPHAQGRETMFTGSFQPVATGWGL
jgi:hypothetical protein